MRSDRNFLQMGHSDADRPEMPHRYPDLILLARRADISNSGYISNHRKNVIFADSWTSDGTAIQVSLPIRNLPAVSNLSVHCPDRGEDFSCNPAVIFSRDNLILLDVSFVSGDTSTYFMFRADSKAPSLFRIPDPEPDVSGLYNTGIVCSGDNFAVAALVRDYKTLMFKLSVFDSRIGVWETKLLPLEPSESLQKPNEFRLFFSKVIPLGGSVLGWVDLWRGILVCDVLSNNPELHYIPMPDPMPGNEGIQDYGEPSYFRDVIGCGDLIKLIEMDYGDQYESDDGIADTNTSHYTPTKWTILTWSRRLHSGEWGVGYKFRTEDISVPKGFHASRSLLHQFYENGTLSLKKMPVGVPTLCDCSDFVYLMCKYGIDDTKGWVIGINMNSKMLESASWFTAATLGGFSTAYYPSSFSKYLNKMIESKKLR